MKPKYTDANKYPHGYVRSESTDITRTWAAARKKLAQDQKLPEGNVRRLSPVSRISTTI
jgi:hypothetical protein